LSLFIEFDIPISDNNITEFEEVLISDFWVHSDLGLKIIV